MSIEEDAIKVAEVLKDEVLICNYCNKTVKNPRIYFYERSIYEFGVAELELEDIDEAGIKYFNVEIESSSRSWYDSMESSLERFECEHCGSSIDIQYTDFWWNLEEYE
jgi:hypothetical protein